MSFVNTKTILLIVVMLILIFVIKNIVDSIISLKQNSHIVTALQLQEEQERHKKQFLQEHLYYVNTPDFIENQAREKLGLVKPGEHIVLAPPIIAAEKQTTSIDTRTNWEKWWQLFF